MAMVTKIQKISLVALASVAISLFIVVSTSFADSYVLTASVPYPIPTVASTITTAGATTATAPITIAGSCGVVTPATIVSLWNGAALLGATPCQLDGTFSVVVNLQPGTNVVIPKTSNIANVYGPDGSAVTFTYNAPLPPEPTPPSTQPTQGPPDPEQATQTPLLQVSSPQPFGVLSNSGQVSIDITVQGGDTPYAITIKWGDGKSDSQTVNESGTYTFTHVYKQKNNYTAAVKVTDSKGNSSNIFIPFADVKGAITKRVIPESNLPLIDSYKITLSVVVLAFLLLVLSIGTFMLGKLHQKRTHRIAATKKRSKKSSKK